MNNVLKISIPFSCHVIWTWLKRNGLLKFSFALLCFIQVGYKAIAQERMITGIVYDEVGLPIPQVNVAIKGTQKVVITDLDGYYIISVAIGDTLVFSNPAYKKVELSTQGKEKATVTLQYMPYECYSGMKKRTFFGRVFRTIGNWFRKEDVDVWYK